MRISAALPHGVSALFAESARRRRSLEALLARRLEAAGFEEVVLPIVDYLEPYEALLTPANRRELYQFVDRDGELLALRADFTPMLARLIAPRLGSLDLPLRVYYRGDVIRFQEEKPGRLRELFQLGAELVGEAGEAAEERMLRLFLELVTAGHDRPVDVVLGFAGALDRVLEAAASGGGPGTGPGEAGAALLRRDREALRRTGSAVLLQVAERGVPDDPDALGPPAGQRLRGLLALRDRLATEHPVLRLSVDLAELATLSTSRSTGSAGSAARPGGEEADAALGGRSYYDGLYRALGAEVPAVGFSVGLDRLAQAVGGGAP